MSKGRRRARALDIQRRAAAAARRRARRAARPTAAAAAAALTSATLSALPGSAAEAVDGTDAAVLVAAAVDPRYLTPVGGTLFFAGKNPAGDGSGLWKSDGTPEGTVLVKDVNPGVVGTPKNLTAVGDTLFFTADDGERGVELWKSDGTPEGTVLVKDIDPGYGGSLSWYDANLTTIGQELFFITGDGGNGPELWRSDGTEAGTELVKDLTDDWTAEPTVRTVGEKMFLFLDHGGSGWNLWTSDGTEAGTVLVKEVTPGDYDTPFQSSVEMEAVGGTLFFEADDGAHGTELWKSDGTEAGTVLVEDIYPGGSYSYGSGYSYSSSAPLDLTAVGGTLFFTARNEENGRELWKSDGTAEGTVLVEDIYAGWPSSTPTLFGVVDGDLLLSADDGPHGAELWRSDGTADGTSLVEDVNPGSDSSALGARPAIVIDGTLVTTLTGADHGTELWRSDGTAEGTTLVLDLLPGEAGSTPSSLTDFGGSLLFSGAGSIPGRALWELAEDTAGPTCQGVVATITAAGAIAGTAGTDVIVGSDDADTIDGKGGDDILCGAGGKDRFLQGRRPDGADALDGGPGRDWADYSSRRAPVEVDLVDDSRWTDGANRERDHTVRVENAAGGAGDDVLRGNAGANRLVGGNGHDQLVGRGGPDTVEGGSGRDALRLRDGVRGNDTGNGGRGADTATRDRRDTVTRVP